MRAKSYIEEFKNEVVRQVATRFASSAVKRTR